MRRHGCRFDSRILPLERSFRDPHAFIPLNRLKDAAVGRGEAEDVGLVYVSDKD